MDRDKGNPKNGTFWGFRGGVLFWDRRGTPPSKGGGSRIQGPVFGTPFGGSGFVSLETRRTVKLSGGKQNKNPKTPFSVFVFLPAFWTFTKATRCLGSGERSGNECWSGPFVFCLKLGTNYRSHL